MSSLQKKITFRPDDCIQCHGCQMACTMWRNPEAGIHFREIIPVWEPDDTLGFRLKSKSKACLHCQNPFCVSACPSGAIRKRPEDGIVIVEEALCIGCGSCAAACPFQIPQIGKENKMKKCDLCYGQDTTQNGGTPPCVRACPTGALVYEISSL